MHFVCKQWWVSSNASGIISLCLCVLVPCGLRMGSHKGGTKTQRNLSKTLCNTTDASASPLLMAGTGGRLRHEEIEIGNPHDDEVLVEIKAAGLCHTDYDSLSWGKPIVMGHEGSEIVRAAGKNAKGVVVFD